MNELDRQQRRLAKYARYRASEKGQERMRRYNSGQARREAGRRYRASHVPGPESCQNMMGRWTRLMKIDPADKAALSFQAQQCGGWGMYWLTRDAHTTAAQRLMLQWNLPHQLLESAPYAPRFDAPPSPTQREGVWDLIHAALGREFKTEHACRYWTKKHQQAERAAARDTQRS